MKRLVLAVLALGAVASCGAVPGGGGEAGRYVVAGVEENDMLKLRGGPGTGFDSHAGLPNGTIVRVRDCTPSGGVRWCRVALEEAPGLDGYVSKSYLRRL
ncbi:SH3 domain-containing protein [Roseivivax isoporae]|uniref:SH3b domain-containing protein n=1 Tax=Roseivivax isoporae LMG 25204 TaxID=1449351 RepID=X7FAF3_9RHOB|nr:SH3 domain-containing protein [Roseivivax isoporae]ETX29066.1 hypothetical protein RISW2_03735 [Roseivivax isoporae LMG 25204]